MFSFRNTADLESNIRVHDRISKSYERIHGEIYNDLVGDLPRKQARSLIFCATIAIFIVALTRDKATI